MSEATNEEPSPSEPSTNRVAAWDLVIADLPKVFTSDDPIVSRLVADARERDQLSAAKYGRRLTADNTRDQLVDLYQELLDGAVYARARLDELGWRYCHAESEILGDIYIGLLNYLHRIRELLSARKA